MRGRLLERAATASIIVAALAVTAANVRLLRFGGPEVVVTTEAAGPPREFSFQEWAELLSAGVTIGSSNAEIQVVEFVDLECRFCRRSHEALKEARSHFGDRLSYTVIHYPLSNHRLARPFAEAAECAHEQGGFDRFLESVFVKQDSMGLKPLVEFARDAKVPDIDKFADCLKDGPAVDRIDRGLSLGSQLGIAMTPTVAINRWRLAVPPYEGYLDTIIDILRSRGPFEGPTANAQ
jgi:protein-disulfide isomerase